VFNLEECLNNEFLRPRENRCKWFNDFGVMRGVEYTVRSKKIQFSHEKNRVNQFTKWLNRFRHQENKPSSARKWIDSEWDWVVSSEHRKQWIDSYIHIYIYIYANRLSVCQRHLWDDLDRKETIHAWIDSSRYKSIHIKSETLLNRFRL